MSAPAYYQLSIEAHSENVQALSDVLLEFGALAVTIEDAEANTAFESPLFGEPDKVNSGELYTLWRHSRLHALIAPEHEPLFLLAAAVHRFGYTSLPPYETREIAHEDWVRQTQRQFGPISVGEKIWVIPSWHSIPKEAPADAHLIKLDPGLAFGTGSHPTTRLCMAWLETRIEPHHSVLDYGCGSGILAILARKCGAAHVTGVDIDLQALTVARRNSAQNQMDIEYYAPDACPSGTFDIVVANILANPLIHMADMLSTRVRNKGWLALSGILERQAEEVIRACALWLKLSVWRTEEGWACLTGQCGIV